MHILILSAHPEPKSFCHAAFETAKHTLTECGHQVQTSDLYRMSFNPISDRHNFLTTKEPNFLKLQQEEIYASEHHGFAPDLQAEWQKLQSSDLLILQFPLWWFSVPAILKGWWDRVFAMGRSYGMGHIYETGVFKGKHAMLSLTTGGPEEAYQKGGFNGDMSGILRPIHRGMLEFVGYSVLAPQVFYGPAHVEQATREQWLQNWSTRLQNIEQEKPIQVGQY